MKKKQEERECLEIIKKIPNRLIYAHSYDRGLQKALENWHIIKDAIPDAELHIYYGWNLFDSFYSNNPERMAWKAKMTELMKQEGVFEHGRVSQKELLKAKAESEVHYYPCTFEEIFCISVQESASVGCVPFTTDYAALKDKDYCHTVKGDPFDKETHAKLAQEIVKFLKGEVPVDIEAFKNNAKRDNWGHVAKQWEV